MPQKLIFDGRETIRINRPFPVQWRICQQHLSGSGEIRDLTLSGLSIQLDKEFAVQPGAIIVSLEATEIPALPAEAKIRWFRRPARRLGTPPTGVLCGAIFLPGEPAAFARWDEWFAEAVARATAGETSRVSESVAPLPTGTARS